MGRNITKITLLILLAWWWFPTGEVTDIFTLILIKKIGLEMYIIGSFIFGYILYHMIDGRTLKDKVNVVKQEIRVLIHG